MGTLNVDTEFMIRFKRLVNWFSAQYLTFISSSSPDITTSCIHTSYQIAWRAWWTSWPTVRTSSWTSWCPPSPSCHPSRSRRKSSTRRPWWVRCVISQRFAQSCPFWSTHTMHTILPLMLIYMSSVPRSRLEPRAGQTRTTSPSDRPAWTSSPAGLAACLWFTRKWDWTPFCSRTKSPSSARNTGRSSDSDQTGGPWRTFSRGPVETLESRGGPQRKSPWPKICLCFPFSTQQRTKTPGCEGLCGPSDIHDTLLTTRLDVFRWFWVW